MLTCKQRPKYLDTAEVYLGHELNKTTGSKGNLPGIYLREGYRAQKRGEVGTGGGKAREPRDRIRQGLQQGRV